MSKVKNAVFSEATKKRRPRTSWMVKPSPESEKAIPLIATPGTPTFGEPAAEPAAPPGLERAAAPEPARSAFPPASAEIEKAQPVAVDRGPSPLEIARIRALEQRERQLQQSIEELAELRQSIMAETEQQLVELAAAIARRVIGKELALDPEILLGLAAEGLDALAQGDKVRVRVGAVFDEASIAAFRDRVKARVSHVEVDHDDRLGPGACIVETELGRVDESVELRLASVLAHLFGQSDGSDFPRKGG